MSVAVSQHKNFVGGEWVDPSGGETMEVLNPSTGEVIAEVARSTAEDATEPSRRPRTRSGVAREHSRRARGAAARSSPT